MKFYFEIKTDSTLRALVEIVMVISFSGSLATIAIYINNSFAGIYHATILGIIVFLVL
jgi:hypothetical protein